MVRVLEFDRAVRGALVDAWRSAPPVDREAQQLCRDTARAGERRSLGTLRIARMLLAIGSREAAYRVATAIMSWADSAFGTGTTIEAAWDEETRLEAEADIAVVRAIHSDNPHDIDTAIRIAEQQVAAGMALVSTLKQRRERIG